MPRRDLVHDVFRHGEVRIQLDRKVSHISIKGGTDERRDSQI